MHNPYCACGQGIEAATPQAVLANKPGLKPGVVLRYTAEE